MHRKKKGQLVVVGTGIKGVAHCTIEARREIEAADIVYTLVTDPISLAWIQQLNPHTEILNDLYQKCPNRWETYQAMVELMLDGVRSGKRVVAAYFGHPGVFVYPTHIAVTRAKGEGYRASMQPGISAEDCLFADLCVDPGEVGCQSHEASAFLIWPRQFDPRCALILWQIGVTGDLALQRRTPLPGALALLTQKLLRHYPKNHKVAIYVSSTLALAEPYIRWLDLANLPKSRPAHVATLYIPPYGEIGPDMDVVRQLKLPDDNLYF